MKFQAYNSREDTKSPHESMCDKFCAYIKNDFFMEILIMKE